MVFFVLFLIQGKTQPIFTMVNFRTAFFYVLCNISRSAVYMKTSAYL
jgi:hypothetical protein